MRTIASLILVAVFINPSQSSALQKFERVTVRGSKTKNLQLKNHYASEFNAHDFENFDIFHTENVWDFIPNLNTASGSNRLRFIQIRGIGERSEFDSVPTTSVGYYYDHIDLSGLSGIVASYDIENLQVLKGPQSHLFGDSSIGGNILIASQWQNENQSSVWTGFGSQNKFRTGAKTEVPLNENLSFKAGLQKQRSDGFINNIFLNKKTSAQDEVFGTAGLSYRLDGFDLRSSHIYANQSNGYDVWSITSDKFTTASDRPGKDSQETWGHSIELTKTLSKSSKLVLISSILKSDVLYSFDEDWGNNSMWNQVPGWSADYDYNKTYDRKKENLHLKATYQKNINGGFLNFGLHHINRQDDSKISSFNDGAVRRSLQSSYKSNHLAYLAGLEKNLNKNLKLNLNGRIEDQKITYSDSNDFAAKPKTRLYGFSASLNQKIKRHNLILTLSRGFKGAGFNPEINLTREQQSYSPESLLNHELSWLFTNHSMNFKTTLFYMNRSNQQIQTSSQDNPSDPSDFTVFIDNAAKTKNYGLESEIDLFTNRPLNINLSLGLLKARFKKYELEGVNYSSRELAHAPLYTFAVASVYKFSSKWSTNVRLTGRDEFYFSNSHNQKSSSYALLSAGAQYKPFANTRVSIWGRNILNKKYAARGFYFGNEPPNFEPRLYTQASAPLEYGLDVEISF